MANDKNQNQEEAPDTSGETINDPLTREDVEAPRAEFKGRTPEE